MKRVYTLCIITCLVMSLFSFGIHKITREDDCFTVFEKVCDDIYYSLERTKRVLSPDSLAQAARKIISAEQVIIFGLGNSASVAMDAHHKFLRAGCRPFRTAITTCRQSPRPI